MFRYISSKKLLNNFQEQKKKFREDPLRVENMQYDLEKDEYCCPAEKTASFPRSGSIVLAFNYQLLAKPYSAFRSSCRITLTTATGFSASTAKSLPDLTLSMACSRVSAFVTTVLLLVSSTSMMNTDTTISP